MLQKWKNILTNWINCYFTESDDNEPCVTLDSLLSIISHLRENLNLDESKSAILEAHTVEEFIQEKYPQFTFSNGTVEANTDEELYIVASLLLYFVCVNSKDINIKNAMCSKLSSEDQEVILRFSKCLMECSPVTYKDVQAAITDACSNDIMSAEQTGARHTVSETPPALRSLHSEVRRLQAALDAERFDRNYLQEELARTNLRVEKLSKDKEQYKLEIVNLKAKISMCCGQESDSKAGDKSSEGTAKLMRELQETEERLVQTQGQLEDALYERDSYKTKVNELKQERDKWLSLSQQEGARVIQLSEELSVERRHVQSLKDLVEELRQHHQLNRLDSSQLECDDPDASINSLPHNASICSEACANVVEVQLSEERAKIVVLKQQIQSLQEQLIDLTQKSETEILSLNKIVSEKDNNIFNLKHRINEEIESKNQLVIQYSDASSRLNNEINELEQKLKDNNNQYRLVLESKMQEIQTLQEEKLSLLQSLNDETTKLEGLLKNLNSELAAEKDSKLKLKEDYENHIMKMNEKVLNRNNELVELQNNVCVKSEQIESLHLELRKEKKARDEIVERYRDELDLVNGKKIEAETMLHQKNEEIESLMDRLNNNYTYTEELNRELHYLKEAMSQLTVKYLASIEVNNNELKILIDSQETEYNKKVETVTKDYNEQVIINKHLESTLEEKHKLTIEIEEKVRALNNQVEVLTKAYNRLEQEKNEYKKTVEEMKTQIAEGDGTLNDEIVKLRNDNVKLINLVEDDKKVILNLEEAIKREKESNDSEKLNLNNKCSILQEYQIKAEKKMEEQQKELALLEGEIKKLKSKAEEYEKVLKEKDEIISSVKQESVEEKPLLEKLQIELRQKVEKARSDEAARALRNEEWVKAAGQRDIYAASSSERTGSQKLSAQLEKDYREFHHQVDNTTSDLTHSSLESIKTISDLEKIIHDKNRTITTLQSDITYLKTLVADSENKLLDVTKELEVSTENCQQLSTQLKKIVHQKNEEIAELKKQVNKMSITENRASQIIKVSAKYQAIILKRISEIKSNAVLKELTNFGNASNGDNELRRSLNAGTITMEDLENFLETTDKHLRRCSEKQIALQKERDRLTEVNRITESEIINLKKFLTELSVGFKTFGSVKDLYTQRLSRVVSVQRTVRREILNLDGHINDATMCKLERGYAAVMQDLAECVMNLERWVERSISRTISPEKIKQAFSTDDDRASLASTTFQNTSLEVQLEELENSFQKLLEEVVRAQKGEGARDAQAVTVMEVRAEYEDKLNRMKAKMKQLYQEQIAVYKEKQRDEIGALERELGRTREKLSESSKAYEEHIRALTTELWRVGEKFLSKKDELEWEKKRQKSGSLMSLQHVHSSGLVPPPRDESLRTSDAHSLRSLPVHNTNKREGRGLHMSDEEGEVFDNRWLKELAATPSGKHSPARLSELRYRNSLCPPHLKSSYPAETQFAPAIDEEDIKCTGAASLGGRSQRKEVGITAYKKPGPPTPSKQAGRVSATDSELRESLRSEPEPQLSRKTSTPSRLRSLFRSNKNDTAEGTPRSRRLSLFRKK